MDLETVREALHRQPFRPFVICLVDGRRLPVTRPDSIAVGKRRAFVIASDDSWSFVESPLIASLEDISEHPLWKTHGKKGTGQSHLEITIEQIRKRI